jgi:hypothetical protein
MWFVLILIVTTNVIGTIGRTTIIIGKCRSTLITAHGKVDSSQSRRDMTQIGIA